MIARKKNHRHDAAHGTKSEPDAKLFGSLTGNKINSFTLNERKKKKIKLNDRIKRREKKYR